uniref:vesicle-fusing ATPase n=1 Tax=Octactis speculum TaxID=3111310 RepID=A0A7S2F1P6_9STRA|mmetsp:Transcript_11206/g.14825  ORF Transcript_11206/g.14825 Transcript_11206/m.14825 type:complete len:457 (+) Transcript_11206:34-1404(+)|eukprot:CAMPEP_0185749144 /NCGR_PEP_ID=MMETSP1174-20130828/7876_1 /TAXON_ID=35687 /ORGANISM="Dictyocha speculum, Strain CCMP1381" /LENGTH=456 /DNA_ID=CAMNT_0028425139 /DNA_START=11 /DNA_END=1381 /DNA_ORIENTATION=-
MTSNTFIQQGIQIVTQAIEADNAQEYEKALAAYRKSLEYFMTGLKHEKNPAVKETILKRVEGYMKRAEDLKNVLNDTAPPKRGGSPGGGAASLSKKDGEKDTGQDVEKDKLAGQLNSAIVTEKPNVQWDDVAGLIAAKDALKEAVILPRRFPQLFVGKRRPWKGILLYGPPGTGKSYLAKAVATEADAKFFAISSSDLVSKWQGESEKLVKTLFELARAEEHAIIFIDEIDSMCGSRSEGESESSRRIKTEFLVQMQGVSNVMDGLLVLGATNVPWELDPAIRRRFEKRIYIPLPCASARAYMARLNLGDTPNSLVDANFEVIGEQTDGCSGSDISVVVREALMEPLRVCQHAKQFREEIVDGKDMLTPCIEYPSCPWCPINLSTNSAAEKRAAEQRCPRCGAARMNLYDVDSEKLLVPTVSMEMFSRVLDKARATVAQEELTHFEEWTEEFGQEG